MLAGHSYGGRQSSIAASEEQGIAEALLLLSYPLHPPGKPEQLRTAHFPSIRIPALFVHGNRDGFGSVEEMQGALRLIPANTRLLVVDKAGHGIPASSAGLIAEGITEFWQAAKSPGP